MLEISQMITVEMITEGNLGKQYLLKQLSSRDPARDNIMQLWGFILSLSHLTLDNRFNSARYLSSSFWHKYNEYAFRIVI